MRFKNYTDFYIQMYEEQDYEDVVYGDLWKDCYNQFNNREGQ